MKKVKFTRSLFTAIALIAGLSTTHAQSRLQIIHNAASVALDTVDIYVNNVKYNNVAFRTATPLLTLPAGVNSININDRNSLDNDSNSLVLVRFTVTLIDLQAHTAMVIGVEDPNLYANNPNGRQTGAQLVVLNNINLAPTGARVGLNIFHGATDAPTVDIFARPNIQVLNNAVYGDAAANILVNDSISLIDVRDSSNTSVIATYAAPLNLFRRKSLTVFASGFLVPSINQNGKAFGLFVVDTNGGVAVGLSSVSRVQFVHNAPDTAINVVDLWINGVRVANNIAYPLATPQFNQPIGTFDVTIATQLSTNDTLPVFIIKKIPSLTFVSGKNYILFSSGVLDTNRFASNPDGINRSLQLIVGQNVATAANTGQVLLAFANTTIDAPTFDMNEIRVSGLKKIGDNIAYGNVSNGVNAAIGTNVLFNITNADSSIVLGTYKLNTAQINGRSGVIFTTGSYNPTGNPSNARPFALNIVTSDGVIRPLTKLTTKLQVIHNSADVTNAIVDVYVNGTKALANFKFRQATPFLDLEPFVSYTFAVAPANSNTVAEAFSTVTATLDSTKAYYAIAAGLKNTALYAANPNGKDRAFKIVLFENARTRAALSKNIDLLYFHGATDLQTTTIKGVGQVQFTSKDNSYGEFHGYRLHSPEENIRFDVRDVVADSTLVEVFGNLAEHQGEAGLIFMSGFRAPASNINGSPAAIFIAWADGNIDTLVSKFAIGLKERNILNSIISVSPNPANNNITISYQLKQSSAVIISVFDITGKLITTLNQSGLAGLNQSTIDIANLKGGLYFLQVNSGQDVVTKKFVVSPK